MYVCIYVCIQDNIFVTSSNIQDYTSRCKQRNGRNLMNLININIIKIWTLLIPQMLRERIKNFLQFYALWALEMLNTNLRHYWIISVNLVLIFLPLRKLGWIIIDSAVCAEITPPAFKFVHCPRKDRTGGGTGLLERVDIIVHMLDAGEKLSFEFSEWELRLVMNNSLLIVIIYRPLFSLAHPSTVSSFISDFTEYLETLILSSCP